MINKKKKTCKTCKKWIQKPHEKENHYGLCSIDDLYTMSYMRCHHYTNKYKN